jgi:iron complex transport system substrate-binding protein
MAKGAGAGDLALDGDVIVDSMGRRTVVAHPFQRIISLYGAHTENLFDLGGGDQVVGVSRNEDWPPEARSKPVHSYHDDLERFLAARPDLVLIRPMIDRGYAALVGRMRANGITVVSLQPGTVAEMFVYWRILGKLSGRVASAEAMVAAFRDAVACIGGRTDSIENKKRVYFEAIHRRMRTFAPDAMAIFALETAGGINVAATATSRRGTTIADYGIERILSQAEEIDVYLAQVGPMNHPTLETIQTEPGYALIRAVRENRIYFIDEKLVSRPTRRMLHGICEIGRILYPERFAPERFANGGSPAQCLLRYCGSESGPME